MILTELQTELTKGSHYIINTSCDICGREKEMEYRTYFKITKGMIEKCYCHKCSAEKAKITNLERYGCVATTQNKDVLKKMRRTNLERYGIEYPSKLDKCKEKQKNTNIERYGYATPLQNIELMKSSMLKKYNVEFAIQYDEFKNKIEKTNIERYGVKNTFQHKEFRKKYNLKIREQMIIDNNIIDVIDHNYLAHCDICDNNYLINDTLFYARKKCNTILCTTCNPVSKQISGLEIQLKNFISDNYNGIIILNSKNITKPYEIDIYLPDLKLAFEFNGIHWHSELYKENNYHLNKTNLCEKKGVQLIHIFEDEWLYKQDLIKSLILNKLYLLENNIDITDCEIKEIFDDKLVKYFLNTNHIQGYIGSKVKIGLFYKNELVSIMIFGMIKNKDKNNNYEMLRFCNKINTNIIDSISALFNYFINNYNHDKIIVHIDRTKNNIDKYEKIGFELNSITNPEYYYIIDNIRYNRFNFKKNILIKNGYDSNKTEHEIMLELKYYRIYDSGNLKMIYSNNF